MSDRASERDARLPLDVTAERVEGAIEEVMVKVSHPRQPFLPIGGQPSFDR
jgi:hypothetical protein